MMKTEQLIRQLVSDARPVRRLRSPLLQATIWVAFSAIFMAIVTIVFGVRPDLGAKLREALFLTEVLAAALTGITAAIAAFHVALPDRNGLWTLLPMPSLLLWLSTVGYGCMTNWIAFSTIGATSAFSAPCLAVIALGSVPTAAILFYMLRHARYIRAMATAGVASIAVAGLTVSALRMFHELDATAMVLIWNVGAGAAMTLIGTLFGRRLFRSAESEAPSAAISGER